MFIRKIKAQNFRLLKCTTVDLEKDLSLLIGKNNTGKTSFLVLFEKFYLDKKRFTFNDFSLSLRDNILSISESFDVYKFAIRMIVDIEYTPNDNLANISELILDLDPDIKVVRVLFECTINSKKLIKSLNNLEDEENKKRYIKKHLKKYLDVNMYTIDEATDLMIGDRSAFIKKDIKVFQSIINFQIIHARREVMSSEANDGKVLSKLTTTYYDKRNKSSENTFSEINKKIIEFDKELGKEYDKEFNKYLETAKRFLKIEDLKVVSNLKANELIKSASSVIYGNEDNFLPEHLNGLGYLNILYVLLSIEIKKLSFENDKRDINLLFLEEPEAHTHPQMQYIFAKEIKSILQGINTTNLQTVISTHSPHIVSQQKELFENIRYFMKHNKNISTKNVKEENITSKNFKKELVDKYENEEHFKFINQYINIQASELFFADKIILIEGTTERLLLPHFINKLDNELKTKDDYKPLAAQNLSILEVGANGKVFEHFLNFLGIKTLIITDIDTTDIKTHKGEKVKKATYTSNATIKHFLSCPELPDKKKDDETTIDKKLAAIDNWMQELKKDNLQNDEDLTKIVYQTEENGYHARSFEDAFININFENIKNNLDLTTTRKTNDKLNGVKSKSQIKDFDKSSKDYDYYDLTEDILEQKSAFAASILYLALTDEHMKWNIPQYIKNGLEWLAKN